MEINNNNNNDKPKTETIKVTLISSEPVTKTVKIPVITLSREEAMKAQAASLKPRSPRKNSREEEEREQEGQEPPNTTTLTISTSDPHEAAQQIVRSCDETFVYTLANDLLTSFCEE